jgi:hypothetical protein
MFKYLHWLSWVVAFAMALQALLYWGGIGLTPNVGERVIMQSAKSLDTMGVAFYTHTGQSMYGVLAPDAARNYAQQVAGSVFPSLDGQQYGVPQRLRAAMTPLLSFSHYGTPWAFIVAGLLYWRRPKPLKSLGR